MCDRIREELRERQAREVLNSCERLMEATANMDGQITDGGLVSKNPDSAISRPIGPVKANELLVGNPAECTKDGTKNTVSSYADGALEALHEIAHFLGSVASHGIG
ncbi:MAG: hypothetical protein HPY44_21670 [Armatimonadetes bacterium]|nr:hypothetical protein [Armatimonadota bacterium]